MDNDDSKHIIAIKNGDIEAYRHIVDKYKKRISRIIAKYIYNPDDADDIVQETFIKFYKAIDKFDTQRQISPYINTIAKNEIKMFFRKKKMIRIDDQIAGDENLPSTENIVEKLISSVNQTEKKIINLLKQGYTYKQIGSQLQKPTNTIKTIIRRIRLKYEKK